MGQGETVVKEKVEKKVERVKISPPTRIGDQPVEKEPDGTIIVMVYEGKPNVVKIEGKVYARNIVRVKRDLTRAYYNRKKEMARK